MNIKIQKTLLDKGYLPNEVGYWFSSRSLAEKYETILNEIQYDKKKSSKGIKFSIPKGKFHRRILEIPSPYHYIYLTQEIDKSWDDITSLLDSSTLSLTTPVFRRNTNRAISRKHSFEEITAQFISRSTGANYILRADISRFYSTIYTHSIPWALHTKQVAKSNRTDISMLGNRLDKIIRDAQDGQTIGIPIGPDTSFIISELLGVTIDNELCRESRWLNAFRYVDDYYFFFKDYGDAEKTLSNLQKILSGYELVLNKEKTQIHEMPQSIEPIWITEINNLKLDNDNLISFISRVFSIMQNHPNDEVARYSFSKLRKLKIKKANWDVVESFILSAILYDPSSIPYACNILSEYYHKKYGVNKEKIENTVIGIIEKALSANNDYEIIWALWIAYLLKVRITDPLIIEKLCDIESPLIALVMLSLYNKNDLNISKWTPFMTKENLYTEYWLLAYEALVRNWLPSSDGSDYVEEDAFFRKLKKYNVRFINNNSRENWIAENIDEKWLPVFSPAF